MRAEPFWREAETELARSPQVLASLLPGATPEDVARWSDSVDSPIAPGLQDIYAIHNGTQLRGLGGFSFIAEWYPLPIDLAIERYRQCRQLTDLVEFRPLIPFAVDPSVCHLAVPAGGDDELYIIFDDAPPALYRYYTFPPTIEGLLTATIDGLRGTSPDYRAELNEQHLSWINLEAEADDFDH
jgi:hypothetical protein